MHDDFAVVNDWRRGESPLRAGQIERAFDIGVGAVPGPDADARARYRALHRAIRAGLVSSAHDVSEGGLAVALAEIDSLVKFIRTFKK